VPRGDFLLSFVPVIANTRIEHRIGNCNDYDVDAHAGWFLGFYFPVARLHARLDLVEREAGSLAKVRARSGRAR